MHLVKNFAQICLKNSGTTTQNVISNADTEALLYRLYCQEIQ